MEQLPPQMTPDAEPAPKSSLVGRLINVFAAPGEVFDGVKSGKRSVANWLVPVLIAGAVGVANVWIIFSQPAVQQHVREQQARQFQQMVDSGKMKAEDAEKMQESMGEWTFTIIKVTGSVGAFAGSFAWVFFMALVLRLLGKWVFKANFLYMQAVEVVGLTSMIMVLGGIVAMLLVMVTGNPMVTPGPALLVGEFDPKNKAHLLLSSINVVTLWYVGVLAVGLARLSGSSFLKAAVWLYGLWLVLRLAVVFSGMGTSGM